jgi:phosphoglycolate phosphatase-like HAD superfamily hydrolase
MVREAWNGKVSKDMKHLIIFDIDGTLTRTYDVDGACFEAALAEEFGITGIETDWTRYTHATDSFILDQVYYEAFGRRILLHEISRFQDCFAAQLRKAYSRQPDDFGEIAGARAAFDRLQADSGYTVAFGSGGWKKSALFKLQCIGIDGARFPGGFADDGLSREEIVNFARRKASLMADISEFSSVIYVGDGIWDARTCRQLGIPFIGIACGDKVERLKSEGVCAVLPDFQDSSSLDHALEKAIAAGANI